jgi:alkanesulfonate monooxygenase SsuD/methylene tetrahydromethanopterin reductase-like flavin-dependent oxidoreductase (luciferase family)
MPTPTVGVKVPKAAGFPKEPGQLGAAGFGVFAEALGYDSLWASEEWGVESFVELTEIACRTDEIGLGTAILNVFSRTPAVIAMGAASLQRVSGGRALIGVGAGHDTNVTNLHGMDWDRPVRRTHELIELVKALTGGDGPVDYDGQIFDVSGHASLCVDVPVYNAALGPANQRATGRVADGWLPYFLPIPHLTESFERIADAAREADRDPHEITVSPQILAVVDDDDPDGARDVIREYTAYYIGRFEDDAYKAAIAAEFHDEAIDVADAWADGDEDAAAAFVTDPMVDAFGIAGTTAEARDRLREVLAMDVVDRPIVYVPYGVDADTTIRTIEALRPGAL